MSSNMLAGERRWASSRRSGMTVLGKVAVPKPLNLPSQRLENHGLDPSAKIVPKGTLGWGSRPSSSGSNAWVSSSQSPNADGRPSSGGSGATRPSTAGSCDRTHEPVASAWGSNSRPSSASGALASNHSSSTSLRPRSAETRPNSSQLSRFAEPASESSVAWGPNSASERLGVNSSKGDWFSLSSGDFPTLGTEKENTVKNFESQDHGHPNSASASVTSSKEDAKYHADPKSGVVNTWRPDESQMEEDSFHPSIERWQVEHPQNFNPNIPPQHFDAWRGPPVNAPAGVWYGGPPRGPAFPMESFPYYRPQILPPGGPRGPHQKNGEFYRSPPGLPHMSESYARPGMPFRPDFYQGPPGPPGPMTFEGYYGPRNPMGYHNNERDIPYIGSPAAPPVYNYYQGPGSGSGSGSGPGPGPNGPDTDVSHGRHKEWDWKEQGENWEHHNVQPRRNNEWGADDDAEREMSATKRTPNENSSCNSSYRDRYSDSVDSKSFGVMHNVDGRDGGWINKSAIFPPEVPQQSIANERESAFIPANKDPILMRKFEGLNAKIRASDGRQDALNAYNNTAGDVVHHVPQELIGPAGENQIQLINVVPRRTHHGGVGKGKFNNQDNDGWRRKPFTAELSAAATASNLESSVHAHNPSFAGEAVQKLSVTSVVAKVEGEFVAEAYDSTDIQAQRAKMRELAKQRVLQLQKEEEERIMLQKAKALAKLEELNRRSQTGEKLASGAQGEEDESCTAGDALMGQPPNRNPVSESDIDVLYRENSKGKSDELLVNLPSDAPQTQTGVFEYNASLDVQTLSVKENSHVDNRKVAVRSNDVGPPYMHKRSSYKQKQNTTVLQKTFNEKSVPNSASEALKSDTGITDDVDITSMGALPSIESNVHTNTGPSTTTQRKKVNKTAKNKHKVVETQAVSDLAPVTSEATSKNLDGPVSTIEPEGTQLSSALPSEESKNRSINNWKPQPVHRMPKSQQAKRFTDKAHGSEVIWAPVRTTHHKADDSVEKSTVESIDLVKSGNAAHNNSFKGKRAEMERYVPKPVAKELAQQGNTPLSPEVPVMVQFGSVTFESISSINASVGSSSEIKEGDGSSHSKHKKEHWRQRSTGPSQQQIITSGKNSANSEINTSGNIDTDMSSNTTIAAVNRSASVKGEVAAGRGKRRVPGPRRTGNNNPDHENATSAEMVGISVQLAAAPDRTVDIREQRDKGDQTSHWIPKSHTNSTNNQHIDKRGGSEISKLSKKVQPSLRKVQVHNKEESSNIDYSLHDSNVAEEMPGHRHQGFNQDKKPIPAKGRSNFQNHDPVVSGESDLTGNTSGFRRHGGQSNRYARGHEFNGDWASEQDNRPHNVQRQWHYEYQPVGPTKTGNLEKHDDLIDGANNGAQRFRERGQSQPKRGGNHYRRQGGAVRVDSGQH